MEELTRLQELGEGVRSFRALQAMSVSELEDLLKHKTYEVDTHNRQLVLELINQKLLKGIKEPHWTLTPAFWVALIAAIASCIAAYPVVNEWFSPIPQPALSGAQMQPDSSKSQQQLPPSPAKQLPSAKK